MNKLVSIIGHGDVDIVDFICALAVIGWGIGVLNPYTSVFASNAYSIMATLMSEDFAGLIATSIGLLQLFFVLVNGNRIILKIISVIGVMFWVMIIAFTGMATHFSNSGLSHFVLFALLNFWSEVRR